MIKAQAGPGSGLVHVAITKRSLLLAMAPRIAVAQVKVRLYWASAQHRRVNHDTAGTQDFFPADAEIVQRQCSCACAELRLAFLLAPFC
jgi:hypothetical protein